MGFGECCLFLDLKKELEGLCKAEIYEISSDYSEEFFKTKKIIFIPIS
jgi:hypothetical protein